MVRRIGILVFAAVAAWAQTAEPAIPEAEKPLRDRVDKFYTLMVAKKYRLAEAFIAEESKDEYYAAKKPDISGFRVATVEFLEGGRAKVTTKVKTKIVMAMMAGSTQEFELPLISTWKQEDGEWKFYLDLNVLRQTPFGQMKPGPATAPANLASARANQPDPAALQKLVQIDRTSVQLTAKEPAQKVTIRNGLPGPIEITMDDLSRHIPGLTVSIPEHVEAGKSGEIRFEAAKGAKIAATVHVFVAPLNNQFDVSVTFP